MAVESGQFGKIAIGSSDLNDIRDWSFDMDPSNKLYSSSSTPSHKKTVPGVKAGKVNFNMYFDVEEDVHATIKGGDLVTLLLHTDATRKFTVPARIGPVRVNVAIEEGDPIEVSVEADTHGAWTYPNGDVST